MTADNLQLTIDRYQLTFLGGAITVDMNVLNTVETKLN